MADDSSSSRNKDLIGRAKQGDQLAFGQLYQQYGPQILLYLTRLLGNPEDAKDIMQNTFLKALRGLPNLREEHLFKAWLYTIATREGQEYLHRTLPQRWYSLEEHDELCHLVTNEGRTTFEELVGEKELIQQALSYLSPRYRKCILLQILGGFRQKEIAEILEIEDVEHISTYVHRGLERLHKVYTLLEQEQKISGTRRVEQ